MFDTLKVRCSRCQEARWWWKEHRCAMNEVIANEYGWVRFADHPPQRNWLVQFHNGGPIFTARLSDVPQDLNAWSLWWRPTGIARMQMGRGA